MGMMYVQDRFVEKVRLTLCELKTKEIRERLHEANGKDERTNKEKRTKKENKKKEEMLTHTPVVPTLDEVKEYMAKEEILAFSAEQFMDYYNSKGWLDRDGQPVFDWRAKLQTWTHYRQFAKEKQPSKTNAGGRKADKTGTKRKTLSCGGNKPNGTVAPPQRSRRQELEMLMAREPEQVKQMVRAVVDAAERSSTPEATYTARQMLDDVRQVVSMPDVYTGLTPQHVSSVLSSVASPIDSDALLSLLYSSRLVRHA